MLSVMRRQLSVMILLGINNKMKKEQVLLHRSFKTDNYLHFYY